MAYSNPNVASVSLVTSRDGREGINTFHVTKSPPASLTLTDLQNIAGIFHDWWTNSYKLYVGNNVGLDEIRVRKLDTSDPLMYDEAVSHEAGTQTPPIEPANVTAAISWRTGLAGRKQRGRFYALGTPTGGVTSTDLLTSAFEAAYALVGANLIGRLFTGFFDLVIAHRSSSTFTKVLTCVVEGIIDSQRRRLPGRGR
jgi:hypothetical protein